MTPTPPDVARCAPSGDPPRKGGVKCGAIYAKKARVARRAFRSNRFTCQIARESQRSATRCNWVPGHPLVSSFRFPKRGRRSASRRREVYGAFRRSGRGFDETLRRVFHPNPGELSELWTRYHGSRESLLHIAPRTGRSACRLISRGSRVSGRRSPDPRAPPPASLQDRLEKRPLR
jgi:hypothetical protein